MVCGPDELARSAKVLKIDAPERSAVALPQFENGSVGGGWPWRRRGVENQVAIALTWKHGNSNLLRGMVPKVCLNGAERWRRCCCEMWKWAVSIVAVTHTNPPRRVQISTVPHIREEQQHENPKWEVSGVKGVGVRWCQTV